VTPIRSILTTGTLSQQVKPGPHLKAGKGIHRWFWVASGTVQFPNVDKVEKRLAEHGITFVGPILKKKHLR